MAQSEFDVKLLRQVAEMHEGIASARLERASKLIETNGAGIAEPARRRPKWSQDAMLAASGLVIAASCWSLIEPKRATSLYQKSAQTYRDLGHGYWVVLALASGNRREIAAIRGWIAEQHDLPHVAVAFGMVGDALIEQERQGDGLERLEALWRHVGNVPVGRLGVPLDIYGQCARAMRGLQHEPSRHTFVISVRDYISRAAEVRKAASHDAYHWKHLMSTALPAEPEGIAMTAALATVARAAFRMPLVELLSDLDPHGRVLVEIGDGMRAASSGDDGFRQ